MINQDCLFNDKITYFSNCQLRYLRYLYQLLKTDIDKLDEELKKATDVCVPDTLVKRDSEGDATFNRLEIKKEITVPCLTMPDPKKVPGFVDSFAPDNWTFRKGTGNGSYEFSSDLTMLRIVGSNNTFNTLSNPRTEVCISVTCQDPCQVGFRWEYSTSDVDGPAFDPFGVRLDDGPLIQLTDNNGGDNQSGEVAIMTLLANQTFTFCLTFDTTDNKYGAAEAKITDFFYQASSTVDKGEKTLWINPDNCQLYRGETNVEDLHLMIDPLNNGATIRKELNNETNVGAFTSISGGRDNTAAATNSVIGGGQSNTVSGKGSNAAIGGGYRNNVSNTYGAIAGGLSNSVFGTTSAIGGGLLNDASGAFSTIGGGLGNKALGTGSTIGGGGAPFLFPNVASGYISTIGGGCLNVASDAGATVGGGHDNAAMGFSATVAGGINNSALGFLSTVGGGWNNTASGVYGYSTVSGGASNLASGDYDSTVCGGFRNTASGFAATVCGGFNNDASGNNSIAMGYRAKAMHECSMVVGLDCRVRDDAVSQANNSCTLHFGSNLPGPPFNPLGPGLYLPGTTYGPSLFKLAFDPYSGQVTYDVDLFISSEKVKKNVETLQDSSKLGLLKPKRFQWRKNNKWSYGFIAEEVEEVMPDLVNKSKNGQTLSIHYEAVIALLTRRVEELAEEIADLKRRESARSSRVQNQSLNKEELDKLRKEFDLKIKDLSDKWTGLSSSVATDATSKEEKTIVTTNSGPKKGLGPGLGLRLGGRGPGRRFLGMNK